MKKSEMLIVVMLIVFGAVTLSHGQTLVKSGRVVVDLDQVNRPGASSIVQEVGSRGNILQNPGFESGSLTPWYTNNWNVTTTLPHSGTYCATDIGNYWLRQDFSGIPVSSIKQILLWSRQPEQAIQAVDMMYSDGTYHEDIIWPRKDWQQFDVTSWLTPGKVLTGIRVWGYSGGGPDPDITYVDDVSIVLNDLYCDTYTLSEQGGTVNFFLNAGKANASRKYILLGSVTGTTPGTPLPGGMATLPLNWDVFTNLVVAYINTPLFTNFMGSLDGAGQANASLNVGPAPGTAGISLYFAYALAYPFDFASYPVKIDMVP